MREVALMIYPDDTSVKKKRNIKPKGVEPKRKSNRKAGEDIIMEKIDNTFKSRSLQSLRKDGKAGRFLYSDKIEWNSLPSRRLQTQVKREKSNENASTSVRAIDYAKREELKETENYSSRATRRICNMNGIEACLNKNCTCMCFANDTLEDFIEYCCSIDKSFENLKVIKNNTSL